MNRTAALLLALMLFCAPALAREPMIALHEQAVIVPGAEQVYPASLTMQSPIYDADTLVSLLLGEDRVVREDGTIAEVKAGEPWEIRTVRIDEESGALHYRDMMVDSERGAEYEPPKLERTRGETLALCRELLEGLLPSGALAAEAGFAPVIDRWQSEDDYFYSDEEYDLFCRERRTLRFSFPLTCRGLELLDEGIAATVGVNGLGSLTVDARSFVPSEEECELMQLEEAIALASTTRSAPAVLLYAAPVYSDRVSGGDYDLCWYLATDKGNYVVDCVLGRHVCDSWEY